MEPDKTLIALEGLLEEDGSLPLNTALEILAGAGIPLPGISPRTLPGENLGPVVHAAAMVVLAQMDRLPPDAVQAIEQAFFENIEGAVNILPQTEDSSSAFRPVAYGFPSQLPSSRLARAEAAIRTYLPLVEQRSGLSLTIPMQILVANESPGDGVDAVARPVQEGDRGLRSCQITFYPPAFTTQAELEVTAVHELWHCMTFLHTGTDDTRQWLLEGQAEWVASEIVADPAPTTFWWTQWFITPHRAMWQRSYNAIGLYAVPQDRGIEVFPRLLSMYDMSNLEALSYLFAGQAPEQALLAIATSFLREPGYGPQWNLRGRGLPPLEMRVRATLDLRGGPNTMTLSTARPLNAMPTLILVQPPEEAEILVIQGVGPHFTLGAVQFPGQSFQVFGPDEQVKFCVDNEPCRCPDGTPPAGLADIPPPLTASEGIGVAASLPGGGGALGLKGEYTSIEELCLVGTWVADARTLLAANMASYGASPRNCNGQMVLTFKQDGTFTYTADVTCTGELSTGSFGVSSEGLRCTGSYRTEKGNLVILDNQCQGDIVLEGVPGIGTMRLPFPFENLLPVSQPVPYTIQTPGLFTYTFTMPDGSDVTHTWKRQR